MRAAIPLALLLVAGGAAGLAPRFAPQASSEPTHPSANDETFTPAAETFVETTSASSLTAFEVVLVDGIRNTTTQGVWDIRALVRLAANAEPTDVSRATLRVTSSGRAQIYNHTPQSQPDSGAPATWFDAKWWRGPGTNSVLESGELVELHLNLVDRQLLAGTSAILRLTPNGANATSVPLRVPAVLGSPTIVALYRTPTEPALRLVTLEGWRNSTSTDVWDLEATVRLQDGANAVELPRLIGRFADGTMARAYNHTPSARFRGGPSANWFDATDLRGNRDDFLEEGELVRLHFNLVDRRLSTRMGAELVLMPEDGGSLQIRFKTPPAFSTDVRVPLVARDAPPSLVLVGAHATRNSTSTGLWSLSLALRLADGAEAERLDRAVVRIANPETDRMLTAPIAWTWLRGLGVNGEIGEGDVVTLSFTLRDDTLLEGERIIVEVHPFAGGVLRAALRAPWSFGTRTDMPLFRPVGDGMLQVLRVDGARNSTSLGMWDFHALVRVDERSPPIDMMRLIARASDGTTARWLSAGSPFPDGAASASSMGVSWLRGDGTAGVALPGDLVDLHFNIQSYTWEPRTDVDLDLFGETGVGTRLDVRTPASFGTNLTIPITRGPPAGAPSATLQNVTGVRNATTGGVWDVHVRVAVPADGPTMEVARWVLRISDGSTPRFLPFTSEALPDGAAARWGFAATWLAGSGESAFARPSDVIDLHFNLYDRTLPPRGSLVVDLIPDAERTVAADVRAPSTYGDALAIPLR